MIKGSDIFLRAIEPSDIDLLYEWENNTDVWQISDTLEPFSRFKLEQYVNSTHDIHTHRQVRFVICMNDNTPIGCIDLFDYTPVHARIGCGILIADESNRNKGFAGEALRLIKFYCFDILDCKVIYCNILESNMASIHLFEKVGFEKVGLKKDWIKISGKFYNELLYQCINSNND